MERFCFEDHEQLACMVVDIYTELTDVDKWSSVGVIAKYDDAKEILKQLVCIGYDIFYVELENPEIGGYEDEYYVVLGKEGLWCEKAKFENKYLTSTSTTYFVFGSCSSASMKYVECDTMIEVNVGECDCDCEEQHLGYDQDCENCEFKEECRELDLAELQEDEIEVDMPGFTLTKDNGDSMSRISFYSTDKELVKAMAEFYK